MRPTLAIAVTMAATLLLQGLASQSSKQRSRRTATSVAVHKAWLQEIVDLKPKAAARSYDIILKNTPITQPERWIAVSRLEELSRIGVLRPEPKTTQRQAPKSVRSALDQLSKPFPFQEVLSSPTKTTKVPPLNPATRIVQDWVRNQIGPTVLDRVRADYDRNRSSRNSSSNASRNRMYARDVLQREIEGNHTQAEALRTIYFTNWKPPTVSGDPKATLATAISRLDLWIETTDSSFERASLRELHKAIEMRSKTDKVAAIKFILLLPEFASKLLGPEPPKAQGEDTGNPPAKNGAGTKK